jgi:hypothetical protein
MASNLVRRQIAVDPRRAMAWACIEKPVSGGGQIVPRSTAAPFGFRRILAEGVCTCLLSLATLAGSDTPSLLLLEGVLP